MNQQEVMQKIRELAALIGQHEHPTNTLEIALLKAKCVELYEHIQILVPGIQQAPVTKVAEVIRPVVEEHVNVPEIKVQEEVTITHEIHIEKEADKQPEIIETVVTEILTTQMKTDEPSLQELFAKGERMGREELSIHEQITKTSPKNDLNDKFQSRIESLKSAISLNKKIAFVNLLFKENTVEYAKSIDKLNSFHNLEEALLYFSELKHTYNWENDHELVKELNGLIEKRFS